MNTLELVFYMFAFIVVISAMGVVFSRKLMYAAFSLLFTFFGVAGLYAILNADFLAVVQIMIYVGGILVLIVFGIMLTSKVTGVDIISGGTGKRLYIASTIVSATMLFLLTYLYNTVNWHLPGVTNYADTSLEMIGQLLLTKYVLTFLVAAILLLIAFIGAALIARKGN
jgi:NADH-quinone oxidoreductase subunit J